MWCGRAVLMTTCTSRLTDRWGQWESMTPSFPAPDPCCPTSFLFLPVLEPELELPGRGAAPAQRRSRGSLLLLAPTHDPLCYCSFRFPNLVLASFPLPRGGPGLAAAGRVAPALTARAAPGSTWAGGAWWPRQRSPGPWPIAPRQARHLLNPLSLGRSWPAGTQRGRADWPEVAKAKSSRHRPAQCPRSRSRGQTLAIATDLAVPFHSHGS